MGFRMASVFYREIPKYWTSFYRGNETYNGATKVQLILKDMRAAETGAA